MKNNEKGYPEYTELLTDNGWKNIKDINENEIKPESSNEQNIDVLSKIDKYLQHEREKKESIKKVTFMVALIVSIIALVICIFLTILKFVLMGLYDYSFSEATAEMWTSLFNALIVFVNDPNVIGFPIVSITIISLIIFGWGTYFIIKKIKK